MRQYFEGFVDDQLIIGNNDEVAHPCLTLDNSELVAGLLKIITGRTWEIDPTFKLYTENDEI